MGTSSRGCCSRLPIGIVWKDENLTAVIGDEDGPIQGDSNRSEAIRNGKTRPKGRKSETCRCVGGRQERCVRICQTWLAGYGRAVRPRALGAKRHAVVAVDDLLNMDVAEKAGRDKQLHDD